MQGNAKLAEVGVRLPLTPRCNFFNCTIFMGPYKIIQKLGLDTLSALLFDIV